MNRGLTLIIPILLLISSGCVEQIGTQKTVTLFVCPSGESVSDPDLCPETTKVSSTDSPESATITPLSITPTTATTAPPTTTPSLHTIPPTTPPAPTSTTAPPTTLTPSTVIPTTLPPPNTQIPQTVDDTYNELLKQYLKESKEFNIYYEAGDYKVAEQHIIEAKKINIELLLFINDNKNKDFINRELWSVRELNAEGNDHLDSYRLKLLDALDSENTVSDTEYISKLKSASTPLLNNLNTHYLVKNNYPNYWTDESQSVFDRNANLYEQLNQMINQYYDSLGDPYYKYYFQVNPNDPTIIQIADKLTTGLTDENDIKWTLLEYVRDNVNYKHDPKWQTDWIRPPAYTIMKGWGDCDDMAVLLHSLYLRSGIESKFAIVDTDGDSIIDHATVTIKDEYGTSIVWDPTCSNCPSSAPPDVANWRLSNQARDINEYLDKYLPVVSFTWKSSLYSYTASESTYEIVIDVSNDGNVDAKDLSIWVGLATSEEGMVWNQDSTTPSDLKRGTLSRTVYLTAPREETTKVKIKVSGSNIENTEDESDWFNT